MRSKKVILSGVRAFPIHKNCQWLYILSMIYAFYHDFSQYQAGRFVCLSLF